eukprot:CAMPEP_0194222128 /NCGR_PEP_ID=MMETSP0156-20130528/32209_1 /TAXON_ID=33649 /ORGANISM="Thalassionema nitzschioides, Strain L26-B" /LENGTH=297 /DNA_ID=CAMNT_0038952781 /DNA_START=269 /DNA_END=1162 /DNA_ORIENTATION=+
MSMSLVARRVSSFTTALVSKRQGAVSKIRWRHNKCYNLHPSFISRREQQHVLHASNSSSTTTIETTTGRHYDQQQQRPSSSSSSWKDAYTPEFIRRAKFSLGKDRELFDDTPPFTWNELMTIVGDQQNYAALYRSLEMQAKYVQHRDNVLKEWNSLMDYILHHKFHYERRKRKQLLDAKTITMITADSDDELLRKWHAVRPAKVKKRDISVSGATIATSNNRILVPNEFPYHVGDAVEHWCLWKLHDTVNEDDDIPWALKELRKEGDVVDTLHWVNPPHLQSIPEIDHAHIFCLRRK